jgi:hypothetical protein
MAYALLKEQYNGGFDMPEKSVSDIERELKLDKCRPVILSPSDTEDREEKGDVFKDWYEDELRKLYTDTSR